LTPITGYEDRDDPQEPVGALAEFYRAFNGRDLALMECNWDSSDEASMDNPLGAIRRGWNEIRKVYERIFSIKATVKVEFYDYAIHRFSDTFLAVGRERGTLNTQDASLDLKIRTSRWYRMIDGRWRQVHHHGSIEDADLLARYQAMVR
jgi:ketosteroid isomerase-like protein